MFDKGTSILQAIKSSLKEITTANGYNVPIKNVYLYNAGEYINLNAESLPAVLIRGEEDFEQYAIGQRYTGTLSIELFIAFQHANIDSDIVDKFSKIKANIFKKITEDITQGKSYIRNTIVNFIGHPVDTQIKGVHEFKIGLTIMYDFIANLP
ncbi:MAG: hypothetical protein ABII23_01390 [bacterium]